MSWEQDDKQYIIHVVKAKARLDYGCCYYEGDQPNVELELTTEELNLTQFLDQLSAAELLGHGLMRIPTVPAATPTKTKRVKKNARG